jgi:excisionase family DNA binding protein
MSAAPSTELSKYPLNLKVRQVAHYFGVSKTHVLQLRDSGDLQFVNIGSRGRPSFRITRASLALFESKRKTPRA